MAVQKSPSNPKDGMELPEELGDRIEKFPHVKNVTGFLSDGPWSGGVGRPGETKTKMMTESVPAVEIYGLPPNSSRVQQLKLTEGRRLTVDDHRAVMVGKSLNWKVGDRSSLYGKGIKVIGVVDKEPVWDRSVIMSLSEMQDWTDRPHKVTGFLIHVDIPQDGSPEHVAQLISLRKQIASLDEDIVSYGWATNSPPPARARDLGAVPAKGADSKNAQPSATQEKPKPAESPEKSKTAEPTKPAGPAKPAELPKQQPATAKPAAEEDGIDVGIQNFPSNPKDKFELPDGLGDQIGRFLHVTEVTGFLSDHPPGPAGAGPAHRPTASATVTVPTVRIYGLDPASPVLQKLKLVEGRRMRPDDHQAVMVGTSLNWRVGEKINVYGKRLEVVGVIDKGGPWDRSVIVSLPELQDWTDRPHRVTGYLIHADIPQDGSPEHVAQLRTLRKQIAGSAKTWCPTVGSATQCRLNAAANSIMLTRRSKRRNLQRRSRSRKHLRRRNLQNQRSRANSRRQRLKLSRHQSTAKLPPRSSRCKLALSFRRSSQCRLAQRLRMRRHRSRLR